MKASLKRMAGGGVFAVLLLVALIGITINTSSIVIDAMQTAGSDECGGSFLPQLNCIIRGAWSFSTTPTVTGSGSLVTTTGTQTVTNKTLSGNTATNGVSTGTYTFPTLTGGIPVLFSCGTTTGSASCTQSTAGALGKVMIGKMTLSAGAATVDTFPVAYTATDTYSCQAIDNSSGSGILARIVNTSTNKITASGTGSGTLFYLCAGF